MLYVSTIILSILDIWNDKLGQTEIAKCSFQRLKLVIKVLRSIGFFFRVLTNISAMTAVLPYVQLHIYLFCD